MLKVQRSANGDVVFKVSGRLEANNVSELSALLAVVRFLRAREGNGIALRNCPPYIREWIAREEE